MIPSNFPCQACRFLACLGLTAAWLGVAWVSDAHARVMRKDISTIVVDENITITTVEKLLYEFTQASSGDKISTFIIRSGDGEPLAAMNIGQMVALNNIRVVVRGYCIGACASYIFLASPFRFVEPDAIVAFNMTGASLVTMLKPHQQAIVTDRIRNAAKASNEFYGNIGVPQILLYQPHFEVEKICYTPILNNYGQIDRIIVDQQAAGWIPRRNYLYSMGIYFEGYWPESLDELRDASLASLLVGHTLSPMPSN
jgi:hypothetical protein